MPTSGLVISTNPDADLQSLLAALGSRDGVAHGEPVQGRVPIVTDTASKAEDKTLWEWLWTLPGVASVDVAFIYLGADVGPASTGDSRTQPTRGTLAPSMEIIQGS